MKYLPILIGIIGGFFTSRTNLTPELSIVSSVFIVLLALPTFIAWLRHHGIKKGFITIILLSCFAIIIESIGVLTGWPYGRFFYEETIGFKILGIVPWTVPFAWVPLVLGAYGFVSYFTKKTLPIVFYTALFLVFIDLVLDPGAYALKMWIWIDGGLYYGVPLINFMGWFFSGIIGGAIIKILDKKTTKIYHWSSFASLFLTISFWSTVAFMKQLYIPFFIGGFIIYFLITYVYSPKSLKKS